MTMNELLEQQYEQIDRIYGIIEEDTEGTFIVREDLEIDLNELSYNINKLFNDAAISAEELKMLEKEIDQCRKSLDYLNNNVEKGEKLPKKKIQVRNIIMSVIFLGLVLLIVIFIC